MDRHGDERRSFIDRMPLSMDREDLIEERAIAITLTDDNYIRHVPVETFRVQNRGGRGLKGVTTKSEDFPKSILTCFSKDRLLIFTNRVSSSTEGEEVERRRWEAANPSGSHIRNLLESPARKMMNIVASCPVSRELLEEPDKKHTPLCDTVGTHQEDRAVNRISLRIDFLAFATKIGSPIQD